jgi:carbonic anhydrase
MLPQEQERRLDELYRAHIHRTMWKILQESGLLNELAQAGRLRIVGGMYDVRTGRVDLFEPSVRVVADSPFVKRPAVA